MATSAAAPEISGTFQSQFTVLTGYPPYPWQEKLFGLFVKGSFPPNINLPTGSGKTSLIPIWLLALAHQASAKSEAITIPRRMVWVVNRRVVVDQATDEADEIRKRLADTAGFPVLDSVRDALRNLSLNRPDSETVAISTLRGEKEDNREWSDDPSRPAIIVGTVDMIGSRLLFSGYGDGPYWRAQHAGLLGHDTLIVNDEAHLTGPFAELLSAIEKKQPIKIKPFHTIRLSATHPSSKCWPDSLDDDQKNEHFRAIFRASKHVQIRDAGKQFSTLLDLATETRAARTLIFVQQPDKVKEIAERLAKRVGEEAATRILTLTGTMRGLERDLMVESPVFKAFGASERPSQSCWLVATSAGEVGINISADRLITELETLDHLLQRFGRLNRFGETEGEAYVLVSSADEKEPANKETLAFLRSLPTKGDDSYDISPAALFGLDLPAAACSDAPLRAELHDFLIDVWSQTSLGKHPARPSVDSWLHGKEKDSAQTFVAWRDDVTQLWDENVDRNELKDVLRKYRVLAHEKLQEPTNLLIDKLKLLVERTDPKTPLLLLKLDGSVDRLSLSEIADEKAFTKIAYCQLILPLGCGSIRNGMFSTESPATPEAATEALIVTDQQLPYDVSGCMWQGDTSAVMPNSDRASYRAKRVEDSQWIAQRLGVAVNEECTFEDDLSLRELHDFAAKHDWRFLLKVAPDCESGDSETALLYFGKAYKKSESISVLFVEKHNEDVARLAKQLAVRAGLDEEIVGAIELAGGFHDLGKKVPIWQKVAGNIRQDGSRQHKECIAKPIKVMRGRDLGGFRHELASVLSATDELEKLKISPDTRRLVLHLIATHHGHGRPCFESKAYNRDSLKDSAQMALQTAQHFSSLQERCGVWGLAYLEALLRAADCIASAEASAEEQSDDE